MKDNAQQKSGEEVENFYMYSFKITTCPTKHAHDWTSCPYAHSGESARRREPHLYKPIPCPESKGGNPCPRGDSCKYAHNDFEYWLHPARYKTEYCKQGPGCKRKICFFAHRPDEIRTAPPVVYTKQGPFLDSATTARKKHRLEQAFANAEAVDGGCPMPTSPWNTHLRSQSCAFSQAPNYVDAQTMAAITTMHSGGVHPDISPRRQLHGFNSSASMVSQLTPRRLDETGCSASVVDLHAALHALTNTSTPTTPFGDVSPLGSLTPTTPWSITAQTPFNPSFGPYPSDSIGSSCSEQLLTYLHGIQAQQAAQTPRSDYVSPRQSLSSGPFQGLHGHTASATISNDFMNLANMMKSETTAGDPILYSSLSDGVIQRSGPAPGSLFLYDVPAANERT